MQHVLTNGMILKYVCKYIGGERAATRGESPSLTHGRVLRLRLPEDIRRESYGSLYCPTCHPPSQSVNLRFQDSLEFATPRIHNPIYEFSNGCYDEDGTFSYDPRLNEPLQGKASTLTTPIVTMVVVIMSILAAS